MSRGPRGSGAGAGPGRGPSPSPGGRPQSTAPPPELAPRRPSGVRTSGGTPSCPTGSAPPAGARPTPHLAPSFRCRDLPFSLRGALSFTSSGPGVPPAPTPDPGAPPGLTVYLSAWNNPTPPPRGTLLPPPGREPLPSGSRGRGPLVRWRGCRRCPSPGCCGPPPLPGDQAFPPRPRPTAQRGRGRQSQAPAAFCSAWDGRDPARLSCWAGRGGGMGAWGRLFQETLPRSRRGGSPGAQRPGRGRPFLEESEPTGFVCDPELARWLCGGGGPRPCPPQKRQRRNPFLRPGVPFAALGRRLSLCWKGEWSLAILRVQMGGTEAPERPAHGPEAIPVRARAGSLVSWALPGVFGDSFSGMLSITPPLFHPHTRKWTVRDETREFFLSSAPPANARERRDWYRRLE